MQLQEIHSNQKHMFTHSLKCCLMSPRETAQEDRLQPPPPPTPTSLALSRFASSHHMAEVSRHSIPYWAKGRRSLLGLTLGFRGTGSLFSFVTLNRCLAPSTCALHVEKKKKKRKSLNPQPGCKLAIEKR